MMGWRGMQGGCAGTGRGSGACEGFGQSPLGAIFEDKEATGSLGWGWGAFLGGAPCC